MPRMMYVLLLEVLIEDEKVDVVYTKVAVDCMFFESKAYCKLQLVKLRPTYAEYIRPP